MTAYLNAIQLFERLHRQFLDVVKGELDRHDLQDVNPVQAMILYNIGRDEMTVGELTLRGYYEGSNVSYNVKKMTENGYIEQSRSVHDKRSIRVKLTDKGIELYDRLGHLFERHGKALEGTDLSEDRLAEVTKTLQKFERFWSGQKSF